VAFDSSLSRDGDPFNTVEQLVGVAWSGRLGNGVLNVPGTVTALLRPPLLGLYTGLTPEEIDQRVTSYNGRQRFSGVGG
jgi:hypothetical protein